MVESFDDCLVIVDNSKCRIILFIPLLILNAIHFDLGDDLSQDFTLLMLDSVINQN